MQDITTTQRARYMRGEITFSDYYGLLVERLGEDELRQLLPLANRSGARRPSEWRALIAKDEHLNNVPLSRWDAQHPHVWALARRAGDLKPITGSGGWSLSDSVCVLKTTARRYADGV